MTTEVVMKIRFTDREIIV